MSGVRNRFDETWHRLREWTGGQTKSEMLAWQVIAADGYTRINPAHPHGGPDGRRDATCERNGQKWVMAAYFPRGEKTRATIEKKLKHDIEGAKSQGAVGIAFVTNQEVKLADREKWEQIDPELQVDLFHLIRVTQILDTPQYARTREEFLDIVTGPPPLIIRATVIGTPRAFTEDADLLERFVALHEKGIRARSDAAHAQIRTENADKRREAREELARQEASTARTRATPEGPWDFAARYGSFDVDSFTKRFSNLEPRSLFSRDPTGSNIRTKTSEPLTEKQIQVKVAKYRAEVESRWSTCRDYLSGVAWPGLRFRIKNEARSFLTDVEIILTFHHARGVEAEDVHDFEVLKVQDPNWEPPRAPGSLTARMPALRLARPSNYPIRWRHNDDGDLEVTITRPQLRPYPEWRDDDHDEEIVLVVDPDSDMDEITVTYTATAHGYGNVFEGEPLILPVERVSMIDTIRNVMKTKDAL